MFDHPSFDQHERARLPAASVLCTPDCVVEVGGIISVGAEIHRIPVRLTEIFTRSSATHRPTSELADERARPLLLAEAR